MDDLINNIYNKKNYYESYEKLHSYLYSYHKEIIDKVINKVDSDSMTILANVYMYQFMKYGKAGRGENRYTDLVNDAFMLLKKAIEMYNTMAMCYMGDIFGFHLEEDKEGKEIIITKYSNNIYNLENSNYSIAEFLYKMAMDRGNYLAALKLAVLYERKMYDRNRENDEDILKKDEGWIKIKKIYEKAIELGSKKAVRYIGELYHHGYGVEQDITQFILLQYEYDKEAKFDMDIIIDNIQYKINAKPMIERLYKLNKEIEYLKKENMELRHIPHQQIECDKCGNKIEVDIGIDVSKLLEDFNEKLNN